MELTHVAVWTHDLDGAAAFWRSYFNAEIGEPYHSCRRPGFVSRFVRLPGCNTRIEMMTGPWLAEQAIVDRIGWDHLAISLGSTTAVDELAARCEKDGCLVSPPRTTGDGYYEAVITMPEGTRIEITT
jgi:lactoylglutathione lyase